MDEPPEKLFRVFKSLPMCWTIVGAHSQKQAEQFAAKLPDDQFDGHPHFFSIPITRLEDLPPEWADIAPMSDPEDPDERCCSSYFPPPPPPIDAREQHALYEQLHGSTLLRSPNTPGEHALYESFGVQQTADGLRFTTLKPLPGDLRPYFLCYAIRPEL